jgi:hypothetical protein
MGRFQPPENLDPLAVAIARPVAPIRSQVALLDRIGQDTDGKLYIYSLYIRIKSGYAMRLPMRVGRWPVHLTLKSISKSWAKISSQILIFSHFVK